MYSPVFSATCLGLGLASLVRVGGQAVTDKTPASAPTAFPASAPSYSSSPSSSSSGPSSDFPSSYGPGPVSDTYPGCNVTFIGWVGDGWCDEVSVDGFGGEYNTEACGWDGGDCCESDCTDRAFLCGDRAEYSCKDPYSTSGPCANDDGTNTVGDGICDPGLYHNYQCALDGGDCDDQTCSNGFVGYEGTNERGTVCCPIGCTQCGGSGCGEVGAALGWGSEACCINGVLDYVWGPCSTDSFVSEAPCVIEDERCFVNPCGENATCDDEGSEILCSCEPGFGDVNNEYGYLIQDWEGEQDFECLPIVEEPECTNGVVGYEGTNARGSACCPVGCGQCGGAGCGRAGVRAGLDNTDCCVNGVLNNQEHCSVTGEAPCVM